MHSSIFYINYFKYLLNRILNSIKQDESLIAHRWAEYQKYLTKIDYIKKIKEIDKMVYELYGLSDDEILTIETN